MKAANKYHVHSLHVPGSALIMTVVLTSLLAIVGALFIMLARIDRISTSAMAENKELDLAVETVIAKISDELVMDVPGVANQEYYDYPGPNDMWLASLEPYMSDVNDYKWRQISDVTGFLNQNGFQVEDVDVDPPGPRKVIQEYPEIQLTDGALDDQLADADGDGIADAKWIELDDVTSSKGKPIYAAIRVVDNGGMVNVNTAYIFDPTKGSNMVDGSSQMQVNLAGLAGGDDNIDDLHAMRCGTGDPNLGPFQINLIWRIESPQPGYLPFDISDELALRYLYCRNPVGDTRLEVIWPDTLDNTNSQPYAGGTFGTLEQWCERVTQDPNADEPDRRHLLTTYNMDRIIDPLGDRMISISKERIDQMSFEEKLVFADKLRQALLAGISALVPERERIAAQLAVNVIDFVDDNPDVTFWPSFGVPVYYGFEAQPFISEIAFWINGIGAENEASNQFGIELFNPFEMDIPLDGFKLEMRRQDGTVAETIDLGGDGRKISDGGRFVVTNNMTAAVRFGVGGLISTAGKIDPNFILARYAPRGDGSEGYVLSENYSIHLVRKISAQSIDLDIVLDQQVTQQQWFDWDDSMGRERSYYRPDENWNILYQDLLESPTPGLSTTSGGVRTNYNIPISVGDFVTVGDIARVLTIGPSTDPCDMIGVRLAAAEPFGEEPIRLNLKNLFFSNIFRYITVMDPADHVFDPNEVRIKGRVNINTAPWLVVGQLPWVFASAGDYWLAKAIVAYRDKIHFFNGPDYETRTGPAGFKSIGELMQVGEMGFYSYDSVDLEGSPDLVGDTAVDDFEERDVIFSRISNLVTVRSDVFTAYILVRIGTNGPQRRVIAILDRSNVRSIGDKVRIIALHPVPNPQ